MLALAHTGSAAVFEPGLLLPILNTLFAGLLPISIAVIALRIYLSAGTSSLLLMACGLMTFGTGAILAGWLIGGAQGPNVNVTIYNFTALAGALFHFAGFIQALQSAKPQVQTARLKHNLTLAVTGVVFMVGLLTLATLQGLTPTFFVQGSGPTPLRQAVLGTAACVYFVCGLMQIDRFRSSKQSFHYWYGLSLLMVALGLFGFYMQKSVGSPLGWLSRSGHYIAAFFALVAVLTTFHKAKFLGLNLHTAAADLFRRVQVSYQVLVETVVDPIVTLDHHARIIQWNSSAAREFGLRQDQTMGCNFFDLAIEPRSADRMRQRILTLSEAAIESSKLGGPVEIQFQSAGKEEVYLSVSMSGMRDRGELFIVCVFRPSTLRRAAEEAERERFQVQLRDSEIFARSILDSVSAEIAVLNREGVIVAVNAPWQQFAKQNGLVSGYPAPSTGIGSNYLAMCEVSDDAESDNTALNARQGIQAVLSGNLPSFTLEYPCHSPDEQRWFSLSATPFGKTGQGVVVSHINITERKLAEISLSLSQINLQEKSQRLESVSRRLVNAQEDERRHMAIELHDELGQSLTAIKISLQMFSRLLPKDASDPYVESIGIVEVAIAQVRSLVLTLRPAILDDLGLQPALRWLAEQSAARCGHPVEFHTELPAIRYPQEIEITCFRVVQEALTNIARHARARHVFIELKQVGNKLELSVQDDGVGYDVASAHAHARAGGSLGILGMRERARLVGGELDTESALGKGCRIRLRIAKNLTEPQLNVA
jgi:PAS domain S-box-containing protein